MHQRPFLKWPGNKYRCLQHILQHFPAAGRLIEPFTGSAAVFLNTEYPKYVLAEKNPHLINLYQALQTETQVFIDYCKEFFSGEHNQKSSYYNFRLLFNQSQDKRLKAALFLYLNRHAFNGLSRFNQQGLFNAPFGSYRQPYFPEKEMQAFIKKMGNTVFLYQDFTESFAMAEAGDLIYCDPPYYPINHTAKFTTYTKDVFGKKEQLELAELAIEAAQKGCHVFISNHDLIYTRELYHKAHQIHYFMVPRYIAAKASSRKPVAELLAYFKPF